MVTDLGIICSSFSSNTFVARNIKVWRPCRIHFQVSAVCFRYIIVNTLLKGDNKDDDDDDNNNNKFVELAICRMGTYSLHIEFCSEIRVDIRGKVTIFCFTVSLGRSYSLLNVSLKAAN